MRYSLTQTYLTQVKRRRSSGEQIENDSITTATHILLLIIGSLCIRSLVTSKRDK